MADHPDPPEGNLYQPTCVFMLLFNEKEPHILAIQKSDTEGYPWRNQVALPGGHIDPDDANPVEAGFRELQEELNISRDQVCYVGCLGHFQTINHKDIQAFLGVWNGAGQLRHSPDEISRILAIPLKDLISVHITKGYHGRLPDVYTLIYPYQDVNVWGVTAKIFHHFLEVLYPHLGSIGDALYV